MKIFKYDLIKRNIAFFVMCAFFLSILSIGMPPASAEGTLQVTNPSFEDIVDSKPVNWTFSGTKFELNTNMQYVRTGSNSVRVTDASTTTTANCSSAPIPVQPGNVYEASVYCYSLSGSPQLYLEFYNSANVRIGVTYSTNSGLNKWSKISTMGIAPEGTIYAKLLLYSGKSPVCDGFFDDASIKVLEKELSNPGFELSDEGIPTGWTSSPTDAVSLSTLRFFGGSSSLKLEDISSDVGVTVRSSPMPVKPGKIYEASVYSFNELGVSEMYIEYYNISGARIDAGIYKNDSIYEWKKILGRREAPAGAVYATILLYSNKVNIGVSYFDNASFTEISKELANGGFEVVSENIPDAWSSGQVESLEASTQKVYEGIYSLKLSGNSNSAAVTAISNKIPVDEGNEYEASVYSFNENGSSEIYLDFYNSDDVLLLSNKAANNTINEWKAIAVKGVAPYNVSYVAVKLATSDADTGTAYFDKAAFRYVGDTPVREFPLKEAGHPRLYFTGSEITSLRSKAADTNTSVFGITGKDLWSGLESSARGYLNEDSVTLTYYGGYNVTFPLPPQQPGPMAPPPTYTAGAYPYWTAYSKAIQQRIETLSLAYSVTGDMAFADKAKEYALTVAGWEVWSDANSLSTGWHTNLDTSHLTFGMSAVYDMLYDVLTEAERDTIEAAIVTKGLEPLFMDTKTKLDHNIQMLRACALGTGAAVILGKNPDASMYLTRATDYYKWYLDMRMNSGQQEGLMYTSYAMENLMRAIDVIARTTGEMELIEHPFINDYLIKWAVYSLIPGGIGVANFSDGSVSSYFYNTMSIAGTWLDNGYAGWYLANAKPSAGSFEKFLYYNPNMKITSPETLEQSAVFDEIGWAALRTGWDKDDTMLAFVSNNSKLGHNHYDQNSIILGTNNSILAADAGYQDYSPGAARDFTLKYGHSTIFVDGKSQSALGGGVLTEGLLSPYYDYVKGSAARAYAYPSLSTFDRHIVNIKPGYYVMLDDLKSSTPRTYDWVMYNGNPTEYEIDGVAAVAGQSIEGNNIYMRKSAAQLAAKFLAPGALPIGIETYPGAEGYGPFIRVGSGAPSTEHKFLSVIKTAPHSQSGAIKALDLGAPIDSSGQEYKSVSVGDLAIAFYKAFSTQDYLTLKFNVGEAGEYDLGVRFIKSPLYGKVQVSIDGQPAGGIYDGYNSEITAAPEFSLGRMQLAEGNHEIKFQVVDKNASSGGYYIGIDSIMLMPSDTSTIPVVEKVSIDADLLQAENVIGAAVRNEEAIDYVLFKTGAAEVYNVNNIESDADQSYVSAASNDKADKFALTRGTSLKYNGTALLSGSSKFNAAIDYNNITNTMDGIIEANSSVSMSVYTGSQAAVLLDNQQQNTAYNSQSGIITLTVPAGRHRIVISDTEAPEFTVKANGVVLTSNMEFTELESVTFSVYAADAFSGIADIEVSLDGNALELNKPTSFIGLQGEHNIKVIVTDAAGNVASADFNFKVVTDIASISELIDNYIELGELKGPLVPQLENSLAQALHQFDKGSVLEAAKHMDDFIKHLTNSALSDNVTDTAAKVLEASARWLAESWSK